MTTKRRKTKPAQPQTQPISVSDFKHWLSGVEDMQPADWVPDAEQWKKIRAKINQLSDELFDSDDGAPSVNYGMSRPIAAPYPQPSELTTIPQPPIQRPRAPQVSLGDEIFIPRPDGVDPLAATTPAGGMVHRDGQFD